MIDFTAAQIAQITGGTLTTETAQTPTTVTTDSREVTAGSLYVARVGENSDGHDYAAGAINAGAVLVLGERELSGPDGAPLPMVIVPDATVAMGALAAAHVAKIRAARAERNEDFTVIGITGSAGKTTTKDLLAGLLAEHGPTVAPQGSFNGEVGVPLTVFRAEEQTRYLVIEMGATGIGHITYLTDMVKPDIGVVLVVGTAHSGEFGGVENIAQAKGELAEAIGAEGTVILNFDDDRVRAMSSRATAPVLGFGEEPARHPGVLATHVEPDDAGRPTFDITFPSGFTARLSSGLIGMHHLHNVLAAAAAATAAGIDPADVVSGLNGRGASSRWRMEITERSDGVTIINDAYNANPESMRAALKTLAQLSRGRRRAYAVLGAMLELGEDSIREHTAVGTQVVRLNIDQLLVVGKEARSLYISAINEGSWGSEVNFVEDLQEAEEFLAEAIEPGDLVLFKSSNGIGLRHLGDRIALQNQAGSSRTASVPVNENGEELSGEELQ